MTFPIWNSDSEHHININMKNFYLSFAEATIYPIPSQAFCYFQNQWIWKMSPGMLSGPAGPLQPEKFNGRQDDKVDGEDYTGGGVGQFCSSLLSLQLKLPSHLSIQRWWWQSFMIQCHWQLQKPSLINIILDAAKMTKNLCNEDCYKNFYFSLMQWWRWRWLQEPELVFNAISILASKLLCRASHCFCLFPKT